MKKFAVLPVFLLFACGFGVQAKLANSDKPIKVVTNNWTSQIVLAHVTGSIFKHLGYTVEYVPISTSDQWGALSHGAAHVQVEVWEGTMADMFDRMTQEGGMIDAGTHSAKTREEWWFPAYSKESCPGLPDWKALKECAEAFAEHESDDYGTYFAGPWEKPDEAKIRALAMNFRVKILEQGDDLWVELKKAVAEQRPIVLFNWTPNWVESQYEGAFVEFPEYAPECETDPEWGVNPEFVYDCGNPKNGWLKKAAWSGMPKTWDCAYRTLENIDFTNSQIASAASLVDVEQYNYQDAAQKWMQQNQKVWTRWIAEGCN